MDVTDKISVPNFVCNVGRRVMVNIRYVGFLVGGASLVSLGLYSSVALLISIGLHHICARDPYCLI